MAIDRFGDGGGDPGAPGAVGPDVETERASEMRVEQFEHHEGREPRWVTLGTGHPHADASGMNPPDHNPSDNPQPDHLEDITISPHHDGASVPYIDFTSFAKPLDNLNLPPSPHHADESVPHLDITVFDNPVEHLNLPPSPHHADESVQHAPDNTLIIPQYDPPPHLDISPLPNFDVHHI
jgi:hypothetical protein